MSKVENIHLQWLPFRGKSWSSLLWIEQRLLKMVPSSFQTIGSQANRNVREHQLIGFLAITSELVTTDQVTYFQTTSRQPRPERTLIPRFLGHHICECCRWWGLKLPLSVSRNYWRPAKVGSSQADLIPNFGNAFSSLFTLLQLYLCWYLAAWCREYDGIWWLVIIPAESLEHEILFGKCTTIWLSSSQLILILE